MGEFLIALGKDIRDCRKANRITLEKLELVTGITRKTLIRLEKGEDLNNSPLKPEGFLGTSTDFSFHSF